jgi:hypothetical protein
MKQRYIIFFLIIIFLEGCKYTKTYDNGIVFKECHKELYSIGNNEYNFEKIFPNTVYDVLYDQFTGKIWIHRIIDENSIFQFIEDDGSLSREIIISYNNIIPMLGGKSFINNNVALFSASGDLKFICVNLNNQTYSIITLDSNDFLYKPISGFSGDFIFTDDLCYEIKQSTKHFFPIDLSYTAYMAKIDKVIGITNDGNIVLLNYKNNTYETLPVKRKLNKHKFIYIPECLYYADEDNIYYSQYSKWYPSVLYFTFFMDTFEPIKWFRYNKKNGKQYLLQSPTEHSLIVGVTK